MQLNLKWLNNYTSSLHLLMIQSIQKNLKNGSRDILYNLYWMVLRKKLKNSQQNRYLKLLHCIECSQWWLFLYSGRWNFLTSMLKFLAFEFQSLFCLSYAQTILFSPCRCGFLIQLMAILDFYALEVDTVLLHFA